MSTCEQHQKGDFPPFHFSASAIVFVVFPPRLPSLPPDKSVHARWKRKKRKKYPGSGIRDLSTPFPSLLFSVFSFSFSFSSPFPFFFSFTSYLSHSFFFALFLSLAHTTSFPLPPSHIHPLPSSFNPSGFSYHFPYTLRHNHHHHH